jgi:hypothetical protein
MLQFIAELPRTNDQIVYVSKHSLEILSYKKGIRPGI